ncbi:MAG TPA: UDP-forming cellulose synthase catalytic subunit, partial [Gammaproteobacteria bacterium]|nr:UDP-forming cellulose synthase catalytic subunit [Gammaproteobacteria bacterium]
MDEMKTIDMEFKPRKAGLSGVQRFFYWLVLLLAAIFIVLVSTVHLDLKEQLIFAVASLLMALLIRPKKSQSRFRLIVLIMISVGATGRYIFWRVTESMGWFDPAMNLTFWDQFFSIGLLAAETYAWTVLFLGYLQTIWPLRRPEMPLPEDQSEWPTVDVFIPTYNEPLNVVKPSVIGAQALEWPEDKLNVYLLDDGCRPEFRDFAEKAGVHYIERVESAGAKAGNINHALRETQGQYIAIFDSDHVPVRGFLQKTMGWFSRDKKLALVQTPHLFFTPDPVERNLQIYHKIPNEGQLFYGLVQDGNDNWNATFFCGSCAVLKREALEEIGGVAIDTVTEDAHTSLKMHKKGWRSAYLNTPLAAGLATERLSEHIHQRRRWALGMTQIFRKDNPLFASGLSLVQRLSYLNAMLHFLFSLPRLIFLTAPLAYLLFEINVIQATASMIAVYALSHLVQAHVANTAMQGRFRHSFWAEVYETILAPHILFPTISALLMPDRGRFNVTNKGGVIEKDHFDWASSRVIFVILVLNILGLIVGFFRLFFWNTHESGTVIMNLSWTVYNLIIIGAALAVAWEKRQRRANPRIRRKIRATVRTQNGRVFDGITADISTADLSVQLVKEARITPYQYVEINLFDGDKPYGFRGRITNVRGQNLGIIFTSMSPRKLSQLVYFTHGREGSWEDWYLACKSKRTVRSFLEIVRFGIVG